ncbi:MAG: SprT-like domain-containing protein [Desulfuromonadales bacterium]|nr:SprT-like domain-containing protein [Desulfuromonadales bacterium]
MTKQPTNSDLRQQAESAVRQAEDRARYYYSIKLPDAAIDFSLRGRCAGQARVDRNGDTNLRINHQLLAENLDDFLSNTIPHEVAHLIVNWQARKNRQRPRPHGPEWQAVMQACFNLEPKRCHSYQTTSARIVPRPFLYSCNCREHLLTSIMHNKISRSYQALCKACRSPLKFIVKQQA